MRVHQHNKVNSFMSLARKAQWKVSKVLTRVWEPYCKENELFCQIVKSTCHHQKFFSQWIFFKKKRILKSDFQHGYLLSMENLKCLNNYLRANGIHSWKPVCPLMGFWWLSNFGMDKQFFCPHFLACDNDIWGFNWILGEWTYACTCSFIIENHNNFQFPYPHLRRKS